MCRSKPNVPKPGIFRKAYEGTALLRKLGLAQPKNRRFESQLPENMRVLTLKNLTLG
jgi:hypothetical protein